MAGVNWEKAYRDLESHIEHILKETSALVHNSAPKLRINEIHHSSEADQLEIIIDATGNKMQYAIYLTDRSGKHETIKLPYQYSNTFTLDVPSGRYTLQGFVRQDENDMDIISEKLNLKYKKVNLDEQTD